MKTVINSAFQFLSSSCKFSSTFHAFLLKKRLLKAVRGSISSSDSVCGDNSHCFLLSAVVAATEHPWFAIHRNSTPLTSGLAGSPSFNSFEHALCLLNSGFKCTAAYLFQRTRSDPFLHGLEPFQSLWFTGLQLSLF